MRNKKEQTSGEMGFFSVLFLILLVLKLANVGDVANWSWWWITAPLWGGLILVALIFIGYFIAYLIKKW